MAIEKEISVSVPSGDNADKVDGFHASQTPTPNTIPVLDGNGHFPQGGLLSAVIQITSTSSYIYSAGTKFIRVRLQAASGGSGGADNGDAAGGGSGAGGYGEKWIDVGDLNPAGETVTIGAAGTAGAGTGGNGGNASPSSFGSHMTANGGEGGGDGNGGDGNGGDGGTCTGGDLNIRGGDGHPGQTYSSSSRGGPGGNAVLGHGAHQNSTAGAGVAGHNYGGGAAGASANSTADRAGAVGADAICIIEEYK